MSNGVRITIVAVHPAVTILKYKAGQFELPTSLFPTPPSIGQEWELHLDHVPTEQEKLDQLNSYLVRN